jgi:hypothetical protein
VDQTYFAIYNPSCVSEALWIFACWFLFSVVCLGADNCRPERQTTNNFNLIARSDAGEWCPVMAFARNNEAGAGLICMTTE